MSEIDATQLAPQVNELHDKAMTFAMKAHAMHFGGDQEGAFHLFRKAYELERQAAMLVVSDRTAEPTRSILLRSAAWLAVGCGELADADHLVTIGLRGNPPEEIADELRRVLERIAGAWCNNDP